MKQILFDDIVYTDYGQFDFEWQPEGGFDGDYDRIFASQTNGLVGAAHAEGVYVNLARRFGGSRVQICLFEVEPPLLDADYEDVVEVSTVVPPDADPMWVSWAAESSGQLPDLRPGTYRVRVSARGRDDAGDGGVAEGLVVDEYVIEFWPSDEADDKIVRVGTDNAKYWHAEVGSRR